MTVTALNHPPVLGTVSSQFVAEGNALSINLTATDSDLPAQSLAYTLETGPAGMHVDAMSGLLTWTPTEAQGPSTNRVTVKVTDSGTPPMTDAKTFTVIVGEVNTAPVLAATADKTIRVSSLLSFSLAATDADFPPNELNFALVSGPAGALLDPTSGLFTWTPTAAQSPSTNLVAVRVTDDGLPPLSDTKNFNVVVTASSSGPVLSLRTNQFITEGTLLSLVLTASAPDPGTTNAYSLVSGPPGMVVSPAKGVLTWTPTERDGPGTNLVTVSVSDGGTPPLGDTRTFKVVVYEVNSAPVLAAIPDQTVNEGELLNLTVTATDPDIPANTLTYRLVSGPSGMRVDPGTGALNWTPSEAQGPSSNTVIVQVTDDEDAGFVEYGGVHRGCERGKPCPRLVRCFRSVNQRRKHTKPAAERNGSGRARQFAHL